MKGEAEPRSTIMMPNSITDFSCDRIYFPRAIVVNRKPADPPRNIGVRQAKNKHKKKKLQEKRHSSVRLTAGQGGRASRIGRSYNTESGRERGAIKRQTNKQTKKKEKRKRRKEKGRKNEIYFSHLSRESDKSVRRSI